jgi:hypothetical protein
MQYTVVLTLSRSGMKSQKRLSPANRKRIEKLQALAEDLRNGKNYPITRLTSLKTLCREPRIAREFTAYLASISAGKISKQKKPSHITTATWRQFRALGAEGWAAVKARKSTRRCREILERVHASQCEIEHHRWADVRLIHSRDRMRPGQIYTGSDNIFP